MTVELYFFVGATFTVGAILAGLLIYTYWEERVQSNTRICTIMDIPCRYARKNGSCRLPPYPKCLPLCEEKHCQEKNGKMRRGRGR